MLSKLPRVPTRSEPIIGPTKALKVVHDLWRSPLCRSSHLEFGRCICRGHSDAAIQARVSCALSRNASAAERRIAKAQGSSQGIWWIRRGAAGIRRCGARGPVVPQLDLHFGCQDEGDFILNDEGVIPGTVTTFRPKVGAVPSHQSIAP